MTIIVSGDHAREAYMAAGNVQAAACRLFREGLDLVSAKSAARQAEHVIAAEAAYILRETGDQAAAYDFLLELGWPSGVTERALALAGA